MSESEKKPSPKKIIRCVNCKRYLFTFIVTADKPMNGPLGEIRDFKCPNCKFKSFVLLGVADADNRDYKEKVEDQMRAQIGDGK